MSKGIEALPLKYLVIALVGSIVIAMALQVTNVFQASLFQATGQVIGDFEKDLNNSLRGNFYSSGFEKIEIIDYSFDIGRGTEELIFSIVAKEELSIGNILSSTQGDFSMLTNQYSLFKEDSRKLKFNFQNDASSTNGLLEEGDTIRISVVLRDQFSNLIDSGFIQLLVQNSR